MKASFDKAAQNYDDTFSNSKIGKLQRNVVYHHLEKLLSNQKLNILEINCGTGEDAIWLAKKNHIVIATDISNEMIAVANTKESHQNGIFVQADITTITEQFKDKKFDTVFSNFGGLNCLDKNELSQFLNSVSTILSEKGKLILVIMPKNTLWEKVYFILKGKFKTAFRRAKKVAFANVDGISVPTYYYNPKDIVNLSKSNFDCLAVKPVGFFIPPSYLEPFFKNKKGFLRFLNKLESKIKNWSFLSKFADHYLIVLQKI
ncbi:class I SAM-dependent methyltransferase [uncultured Flavobacterium sp.]|uniref:class I SAM-dependent DNA methyltransferase n=1 Tax=uncultured Flavobacterium sp. TaxID=165435 RepID=UPI0030EE229A|tara:strand:+ start:73647 stop:74426 length:780 start_codon:yes stop_codon:yes gene_type:complete